MDGVTIPIFNSANSLNLGRYGQYDFQWNFGAALYRKFILVQFPEAQNLLDMVLLMEILRVATILPLVNLLSMAFQLLN